MANLSYSEQQERNIHIKLMKMQKELPEMCTLFFRGIEPVTQPRTRLAYAYDLTVFFSFLINSRNEYKNYTLRDFKLRDIERITTTDLEEYLEYLKYRPDEDKEIINKESGLKRKLSSLKSFYNYLFRTERIKVNPAALLKLPKIHEKDIIRLEYDEVAALLDEADSGDKLTEKQKLYHKRTKNRDAAILTLLLGTGMRVSECVGINIRDIDFENTAVRIHRKGGKEAVVYFGDEVEEALRAYLDERIHVIPCSGSEEAFFLSLQNRRMSVRSVENMVKKYASVVTPLKHITPHKLRSTYGTHLYQETGDIYLVADVLGHSDVNTTKKHYAAMKEERLRKARSAVKLRNA